MIFKLRNILIFIFIYSLIMILIIYLKTSGEEINSGKILRDFSSLLNRKIKIEKTLIIEEAIINHHFKYSINFIETNFKSEFFTPRQMCSIESAARNNPNALVKVFSVRAHFNLSKLFYTNIQLIKLNLTQLFANTPLEAWWLKGKVYTSPYVEVHMSDGARLALLWKYGGIYLDLDFLCLKSFESFFDYGNGFGYYFDGTYKMFNNAFMIFKSNSSYLEHMMKRFVRRYNPSHWNANGPYLLVESIMEMCYLSDPFLNMTYNQTQRLRPGGNNCSDIFVFPESFISPLNWNAPELKSFFQKTDMNFTDSRNKLFRNAYSIHLYNAGTKFHRIVLNENSFFIQIARDQCQNTLKYVTDNKIEF